MSDVRVEAAELLRFIVDVLQASGMAKADAATFADALVWANLRGVDTHGVMRLPVYIDQIRSRFIDPAARPDVVPLLGATFRVDSRRSAGPVAMALAVDRAIDIAQTSGVGLGLVSDTTHTCAIGYYAQKIAARGFAAIVIAAGPPHMAYHGARETSLATSPIAIGIPTGEGEPLLLDMATSLISNGRIRQAASEGSSIPAGAALDAAGRPTTDGASAALLLPLGGPKGSGLSLLFECLTGMMAGTPILIALAGLTGRAAAAQNAMVIAINVDSFRPLDGFRGDVGTLQEWIKGLPRQDGVDELLLPGERGARAAMNRSRDGIPLSAKVQADLLQLSTAFEVVALEVMAPEVMAPKQST